MKGLEDFLSHTNKKDPLLRHRTEKDPLLGHHDPAKDTSDSIRWEP